MDAILTVITPCAPQHMGLLHKCVESVQSQTIPCQHLIGVDKKMQGAGFVRNILLKKVKTPYVTFLDADDWIEPNFAELTLAQVKPTSYVYTAWFSTPYRGEHASKVEKGYYQDDGQYVNIPHPPEYVWNRGFHLITSVLSTEDAIKVGGFDPYMKGMEDTDFWLKCLTELCLCPIRLATPLVHYTGHGIRSRALIESGENIKIRDYLLRRYGHKMACCGSIEKITIDIVGQKLEGDVLIQVMWHGNRNYRGKATNRNYGRLSYPKKFWGSLEDVKADPKHLRVIDTDFILPQTDLSDDDVVIIDNIEPDPLIQMAKMMGLSVDLPLPEEKGKEPVSPDIKGVVKKAREKKG